jgi:5-methylcytosine-specific restriction endonuclease McrA
MATKGRGRQHRTARARVLDGATHCTWCGIGISDDLPPSHPQKATVDHLLPRVAGGTDTVDNLVPACFKCNTMRGARDPSTLNHDVEGAEDW